MTYEFTKATFIKHMAGHDLLQVMNMRKGSLMFWAPPCSTWVFLILVQTEVYVRGIYNIYMFHMSMLHMSRDTCIPTHTCIMPFTRSNGSTGRSWLNPAGGNYRAVKLANILVMRMLYM